MVIDEKERNVQKGRSHLLRKWSQDEIQTQNQCKETTRMTELSQTPKWSISAVLKESGLPVAFVQIYEVKKYGPSEETGW